MMLAMESHQQHRFDQLRIREAGGVLTETERAELQTFFAELDAKEAAGLQPALDRMQTCIGLLTAEKAEIDANVIELERIVEEQERLLNDARTYLTELRQKRATFSDSYRRIKQRMSASAR